MPPAGASLSTDTARGGAFATTHWSIVLAAGQEFTQESARALDALCDSYWYPIYAFLRRQGYGREDAQDLTQSFFAFLLQREAFKKLHPQKGKFRSFLLASLKHFLANEWDKARALKRGGQFCFVPLDSEFAAERFSREPVYASTPERAFEQSWATTLLESVLAQLREEFARDGKTALFDALQVYLAGDCGGPTYLEVAARFHLSESGIKMAVLRLRRRFGELLRAEIARTVASPEEIDDEIRCLFAAVN